MYHSFGYEYDNISQVRFNSQEIIGSIVISHLYFYTFLYGFCLTNNFKHYNLTIVCMSNPIDLENT